MTTRQLSRNFGGIQAVRDVDFVLLEGEICAIIGPNGAGKTTFFNLLSGILMPSAGRIFLRDRDITQIPSRHLARLGIARTFQSSAVFSGLTVFENVCVAAHARHPLQRGLFDLKHRRQIEHQSSRILERMEIAHLRDVNAGELSYGDQRVLEIAIALVGVPILLLLDEPTAGMSPLETERVVNLMRSLKTTLSVIVVEHDMDVVMDLADRVVVFDRGHPIADGSPMQIERDPRVRAVYFGA